MNLQNTQTLTNLMRAFAGESMAWSRYVRAAEIAEQEKLPVIARVFRFTAGQEKEHGEIFAQFLKQGGVPNVEIEAGYPVNLGGNALSLLAEAMEDERAEHLRIYPAFAKAAEDEGFPEIARKFALIAEIEKCHAGRYETFHRLLKDGKLSASDEACDWICLNCGHEFNGKGAPQTCPVCGHEQGFFIRVPQSPYNYANGSSC